ncbi:hypothetical protein [Pseudonocardia sp. MH-G8]|uniref:hypothetical protein n=1 Tax=Pseudonocardia sp. MH-G8 TaxID=1854588 RepID=UPI00117AD15C|nr:hypothetical protein [Pseudonocardia sp. MH-G8]
MSDGSLAGMLDDAALFPPENAPMVTAVPAHRKHRASWYALLVGPFLVPAARLDELTAHLPADSDPPPKPEELERRIALLEQLLGSPGAT